MKKTAIILIGSVYSLIFCFCLPAYANNEGWEEMPVITHVYELSKEKVYLEWEGKSDLYQIYIDGKNEKTVKIENDIVDLKQGMHQITVVPIDYKAKDVDTKISIDLFSVAGGSIDLGSLGIEPKDILQGTPSKNYSINYNVNPIFSAVPEVVNAFTDFNEMVSLTFTDKYDSDIYKIAIRSGKDVNYVEFDAAKDEDARFISKNNSSVTVILDWEFLKQQGCMIPELNQKYSFSVKLQKHPDNYVDGEEVPGSILESKESKEFDYTPYAAWKNAPEITYASQNAEGQITLQWEHEDYGVGCEYQIICYEKLMGIKKGETEIGRTHDKKYVIKDLMNGKYTYVIVPLYSGEKGFASDDIEVEVKNDWVVAPSLDCVPGDNNQVILKWPSQKEIEKYHIVVSAGSGSWLRFVNMDYVKYDEFEVEAKSGDMEYLFTYEDAIDSEDGVKLKFEIYGIRYTADGKEQKSATTKQTIVLQ